MARPTKKNVYERIEEKLKNIKDTETLLIKLNAELQELYTEKDTLEMHQLFELVKANGLTIQKAAELLQGNNK